MEHAIGRPRTYGQTPWVAWINGGARSLSSSARLDIHRVLDDTLPPGYTRMTYQHRLTHSLILGPSTAEHLGMRLNRYLQSCRALLAEEGRGVRALYEVWCVRSCRQRYNTMLLLGAWREYMFDARTVYR
jgi:hypothetical protein